MSKGHKKIILYSTPGKEGFYAKLGFKKMNTAMAIFDNENDMIANGTDRSLSLLLQEKCKRNANPPGRAGCSTRRYFYNIMCKPCT